MQKENKNQDILLPYVNRGFTKEETPTHSLVRAYLIKQTLNGWKFYNLS